MSEIPPIPNPLHSAKIIAADVTYETYSEQSVPRGHPDYIMGRSDLADFAACPHKWVCGAKEDEVDSDSTDWGQAFELVVMYPVQFDARCAIKPATYRNEKGETKDWTFAANVCKKWRADVEASGRRIVEPEVLDAGKVFLADSRIKELLTCSQKQVMVMGDYVDKETGLSVPVKALLDLVPSKDHAVYGRCLADVKTARNASPHAWSKEIVKWHLHWQAALYMDLYTLATGEERLDFRHVISENVMPYEIGRRMMSEDFVTLGRMGYRQALRAYCQCLKAKQDNPDFAWPGYDVQEAGTLIDGWLLSQPEAWMVKNA